MEEKNEFLVKYRTERVLGVAERRFYLPVEGRKGVSELSVKEGEVAEIRPFGVMSRMADFTVWARRRGSAFGVITWELAEYCRECKFYCPDSSDESVGVCTLSDKMEATFDSCFCADFVSIK